MAKQLRRNRGHALYDLRITFRGIEPPIWRRVIVWWVTPLESLHLIIQELFGWQNYHLYRFEIRGVEYEPAHPESTAQCSTEIPLGQIGLKVGDSFTYVYDFGDDWELDISVVGTPPIDEERTYPYCVGGARTGPPEDSGGSHRYGELLEILRQPSHPEFLTITDWIEPGFDPEAFDLRATNRILNLAFSEGAV
jgi:hypothetical protein